MGLNWLDVTDLPFNTLLLLEREQIGWIKQWNPDRWTVLATALRANPCVETFFRLKNPEISSWLDEVMTCAQENPSPEQVRQAEVAVMEFMNDWIVYSVDPSVYDDQPFLGWDPAELTGLVDFHGKTVIDIGSGTGKQAFIAAERAAAVFCVEPVGSLRRYLRQKAARLGFRNVYPVDGLIDQIPFPGAFADVVMTGHVYGDAPEAELCEMRRVVKPGGMIILIPGAAQREMPTHNYLVSQGFEWAEFIEPPADIVRKYWQVSCQPES